MLRRRLPLPPPELRFMGRSDDEFLSGGDAVLSQIRADVDVPKRCDILDIGCGYGRLSNALWRAGHRGRYHGIDILAPHIAWCQSHLSAATGGRYGFEHLDLANDRYNPTGTLAATEVVLSAPFPPDVVTLTSVFTHMYADAIDHYLHQLSGLVKPNGAIYATIFFMNESQDQAQAAGSARYPLRQQVGAASRVWNADDPLHVIAHDEGWFRDRAGQAGLTVDDARYGSWCGRAGADFFQDSVVLRPA